MILEKMEALITILVAEWHMRIYDDVMFDHKISKRSSN
jgi:hypothetical protein